MQSKKINWKLLLSGGFFLLLVFVAVFASLISPHSPLDQDLLYAGEAPMFFSQNPAVDAHFFLGTDSLGRDVLSRIIHGTQITLIVALSASFFACIFGSFLGLLAGYYGGKVDAAISRLVDIWMSFPPILLSILLVAVIGTGVGSVIFAIAVIDWTRFCRTIRSETIQQTSMDYVNSAVILGKSKWQILFKDIFINVMPAILVLFTLEMAIAVVVETILSFVGLSVSSDTPTWGGMIAEGRQIINQSWWVLTFPLIVVLFTILSFSQFGEGIKKELDPLLTHE